jgi:hypothetical protein
VVYTAVLLSKNQNDTHQMDCGVRSTVTMICERDLRDAGENDTAMERNKGLERLNVP